MPKTERKILDQLIQYRYWLFLLAATALAWLARKGEQNGFRLLQCQELENHQQRGYHKKDSGGPMYVTGYHYQGLLQITDSERFRHALQEGIGSGRAYGLGMLLPR